MKISSFLCIFLMFGCATKRKLKEDIAIKTYQSAEANTLQTRQQHFESYHLGTDSASQTNFLKLYPKGAFVINNNGFQGSADSLIWYANAQQVSKQQQSATQSEKRSASQVVKRTETQGIKQQKKDLTKVGISTWWLVGCVVACCVLLRYYMRIRLA